VARRALVVAEFGLPVAVKADGHAAGKGVVIAQSEAEAREALESMLDDGVFGDADRTVVVVEDGLTGPNTGGVGSVSPCRTSPITLARSCWPRGPRCSRRERRGAPTASW
jgi:phosphoribosylamine---glycine ligase